jgi:protein tyrosine/serine phosphatase
MMISRVFAICRRALVTGALCLLLAGGVIAACCGIIQYTGNIHAVEDGQLYRSAQLDRSQFEQVIKDHGIKSILNLRGDNAGESWYEDEISVAAALDVAHFDYGISARSPVTASQIREILRIVRDAPKPLLIHCRAGADRTGLVAALYVAKIENRTADEAAGQLSLVYGHFPYLMNKTRAMDESFWAYVAADRGAEAKGAGIPVAR